MADPRRPGIDCASPEDAPPHVGAGVPAPPEGWRREVIPRRSTLGADAYYYSPCGKRMRSKPDVQRFLDACRKEGKYEDVCIDAFDFGTTLKPARAKADGRAGKKVAAPADEKPAKKAKVEAKGGGGAAAAVAVAVAVAGAVAGAGAGAGGGRRKRPSRRRKTRRRRTRRKTPTRRWPTSRCGTPTREASARG